MSFWRGRPVYLTGATGLLGGWCARALVAEGAKVICLVRDWVPESQLLSTDLQNKVTLVRGDLLDASLQERVLAEYEVQVVLHLAAQTIVGIANRSPLGTFDTNIRGTWQLLEAIRHLPHIKATIVASSDKAYGDQPVLPYDEAMPLQGLHPYDVSKSCADLITQTYAHSYGLNVAITRCGNLYGGGDLNFNRIVPGTIRSALWNESPLIRSDGKMVRDYIFAEDAALAYLSLAQQMVDSPKPGEAFNFSYEQPMTVMEVVATILKTMNREDLVPTILNEANNEIMEQFLSSTKARQMLGWMPAFGLEEGMKKTVAWYQSFLSSQGAKG